MSNFMPGSKSFVIFLLKSLIVSSVLSPIWLFPLQRTFTTNSTAGSAFLTTWFGSTITMEALFYFSRNTFYFSSSLCCFSSSFIYCWRLNISYIYSSFCNDWFSDPSVSSSSFDFWLFNSSVNFSSFFRFFVIYSSFSSSSFYCRRYNSSDIYSSFLNES